jgi:hypothetical protein
MVKARAVNGCGNSIVTLYFSRPILAPASAMRGE